MNEKVIQFPSVYAPLSYMEAAEFLKLDKNHRVKILKSIKHSHVEHHDKPHLFLPSDLMEYVQKSINGTFRPFNCPVCNKEEKVNKIFGTRLENFL